MLHNLEDTDPKTAILEALNRLSDRWPSEFVARTKVGNFSGELIAPKTIANLDSTGEGPEGRVKMGSNTGYIKESLIDWMAARLLKKSE